MPVQKYKFNFLPYSSCFGKQLVRPQASKPVLIEKQLSLHNPVTDSTCAVFSNTVSPIIKFVQFMGKLFPREKEIM